MCSTIEIFDRTIPLYGVCWVIGIAVAAVVALLLKPKADFERYDLVYSSVFAVIGGLIGSKLLFVLVTLRQIIENNIPLEGVIKGGFVFYGGLLGGVAGVLIYAKKFKMKALPFTDIMATVLPLGHACGRVGCYLGGCCYGVEYSGPFGVTYTESLGDTPLGVELFPIQLFEALLLFVLFVVLMVVYCKSKHSGTTTVVYFYAYAVMRFVLEFFRGDAGRGLLWGISTSQIISIIIVVVISVKLLLKKSKQTDEAN